MCYILLHILVLCQRRDCPYVQRFYARTFKGGYDVRAGMLWTYVQGVPGRTSKGPLNDGERKLKRNEWDMV